MKEKRMGKVPKRITRVKKVKRRRGERTRITSMVERAILDGME